MNKPNKRTATGHLEATAAVQPPPVVGAAPAAQAGPSNQPLPLRIAQILNRMDSGGIEAVVLNYYRHIDRSKVQFDFYLAQGSSLPQRQELEQLGAGLYPIPPYSHPIAYHRALYTAFKQRGYKIVHAHLSTMSVFPLLAAWRAGMPVRICHNHSTAHWGEGGKTLLKYILRPFNKVFATDWFACGKTAGRWMYGDRAFEAGRVIVLPNAIDTAKFAFDPAARTALREELGVPQNAFVVGHVGRFMYQKNHAFLLKIFAELLKTRPDARLLLVGEGELEQQVRRQAAALSIQSQVIFTGARQDVHKLYSAMDVFCLPSRYEGMPVVAWEAQANGLPCLFSENVTPEAAQGTEGVWLPLGDRGAWQAAFARFQPRQNRDSKDFLKPDIHQQALRLQKWYQQQTERRQG